jgi:hypothetical protein
MTEDRVNLYDLRDTLVEMLDYHGIPATVEVIDTRIIIETATEE